jgi:transcriptional regulator with XRE-family HTH domain
MITIEQCRAARGLLGWTQQDLAESSGLSKTAINNFEKGHSDIKTESLRAIRMAFESADVEFMGLEGLRKKSETVQVFKGEQAFGDLLDDIYDTLKDTGGEILISYADERITSQVEPKKLLMHIDRLRNHNISERVLCAPGTSSILTTNGGYRWTDASAVTTGMTTFIYGGKVALELWNQAMILIINSREAANAESHRFEQLWSNAAQPPVKNKAASL